ncbi:hypothetical protein HDU96_003311 [Phlyctochytrium bullatum]|nr:hypothetical protein HDU96_003311 [Phlyctochytrium bullatum]
MHSPASTFVDFKRIRVTSGSGGDGGIYFWKSLKTPIGPPCGGNGGRGGSVFVVASKEITSLNGLKNTYRADHGRPGGAKGMHGADGQHLEIKVPLGACIRQVVEEKRLVEPSLELPTDEMSLVQQHFKFRDGYIPHPDRVGFLVERIPPKLPQEAVINLDLTKEEESHLLVRGGRGGVGNAHLATNDIKGPPFAGKGEPGRTITLEVELKTLADVGLVGLPNAGKSTILSALSNADSKAAPYPFTTIVPHIGVIEFSDHFTLTMADIPGLVEGAHVNVGLGHRFLRHVERSRVLAYVVDMTVENPGKDFVLLREELAAYSKELIRKPCAILANKADSSSNLEQKLQDLVSVVGSGTPIIPISALQQKNLSVAMSTIRQLVEASEK